MRNSSTFRDVRRNGSRCLSITLAGIFVLCFARPASAIDPNRLISQYMREHWGSEKGFTGGTVTAIAQTEDGYLWIGSDKGLTRFDGSSFHPFQQAGSGSLAIGPVQGLVADRQGSLWILLQNTKILRYHEGKFESAGKEAEVGITSISRGKNGTVLFSSLALGTLVYEAGKFRILNLSNPEAPGKSGVVDDLSSRLSWATGVAPHRFAEPNSAVLALAETTDGKVWLGTRDKGLFYLAGGRVIAAPAGLPSSTTTCLLALENGELWIGTDRGVMRWDGTEITSEGVPEFLRHIPVSAMIRDRDSNIWLSTARGLARVTAGRLSLDASNVRSNATATTLFEDREGNLWTGGVHGIERLRDSAFVTFPVGGVPTEDGGPVYVDRDDRVWSAPYEGGLHWLKGDQNGTVTSDGLAQDVVYSITGRRGELWVGRQKGGLTRLRNSDGARASRTFTEASGLAQNSVFVVYESRDGTVWAGTLNSGVSQFKDGHFATYTTTNGLASNTVVSIAETPDNTMWFATPNGVSALQNDKWRTYAAADGLPSDDVNCLFSDSTGVLWIGTASGLAFLKSGHIQSPVHTTESLREKIFGVAEDRQGSLWISTSNHVLRVNRERLMSGLLSEADVHEYGLSDGLNGTEGVKRQPSVVADERGRIWFSMNRGLSVVDPIRAAKDFAPVLVQVEAASVGDSAIDLAGPIRIPSGGQRITFNYAGLSLSAPERVRYRYRLDGFDQRWSEAVAARTAVYTNLSPGSYRFRVIASNGDGVWTENEASLGFDIVPEFYQTKWFPFLCALAVACAAWAAYQRHVHQMKARLDLQFNERLSERTRIARELHDTLLQSFQGLLLHFQSARNLLPGHAEEAIQRLDTALERAEGAIVEGRNAIHDIRSSVLVNNDLARAISALGEELRETNGQKNAGVLTVVVEGAAKTLDPIVRDEIYGIVREALRNAFSHANAEHIEAEITYGERLLRVRIRDDGTGIDPRVLDLGERAGHWGLLGMRERAKRMGGRLDVWSENGAGTEVELSIPGSVVYRGSPVVKGGGLWRLGKNGKRSE